MIVQSLMWAIGKVLTFLGGLVPDSWTPPGWASGAANAIRNFFVVGGSMVETWVPLTLAFAIGLAIIHAYIGGLFVKGVRILISFFTGGGGSAA